MHAQDEQISSLPEASLLSIMEDARVWIELLAPFIAPQYRR